MGDRVERAIDDEGVQRDVDDYIRQLRHPPEAILQMGFVFEALAH